MSNPTFAIKIRWNSEYGDSKQVLYTFDTKAELEAFHDGVAEASQYSDYELVYESIIKPKDDYAK